ncbi:hypothetical protein Spica_2838 [Gracilinema caldarium DSM 7334]|uniref:Leucine-binding protein domain-containing protein n=2 Tax=Gracilinema caldarium TaxID=215591 RepID=F8F2E9_GRAC1|nr:hypothetical protein Spica_2838 [Gracilinema caldarium DSM 7334]
MKHFMLRLMTVLCMTFLTSCIQPSIQVALLTKLDAGSIIGTSEIAAVKEFERTHPNSRIQIIPFDDGWDPERTKQAYKEVQNMNIQFLITSHTSTCAIEIAKDINLDKRLTIIAGATTTVLSDKDDYILRIIPDLNQEQAVIAQKISSLQPKKLLIIRDLSNSGYTIPAQEAFLTELNRVSPNITVRTFDFDANQFNIEELDPVLQAEIFNVLYLLIGGYKNIAGNIAQYSYQFQPQSTIVFTPWMHNRELVNSAGPAINHALLPSLFPSRKIDPKIEAYMSALETNFHVSPTIISLKVYQALELLDQAFKAKAVTPDQAKKWLLSKKILSTRLGTITFNAFGETIEDYYFITDISGEFH